MRWDIASTRRALILAAAGLAFPAFGQTPASTAAQPSDPEDESLAAWIDAWGRPTAAVTLNGQGPFRFLTDTGATISLVSARVAEALDLQPHGQVFVAGTTGSATMALTMIDRLVCGAVERRNLKVAMSDLGHLSRWDGVLGADLFAGGTLEFDIRRKTVTLRRSLGPAMVGPAEAVVPRPSHGFDRHHITLRDRVLAELGGAVGDIPARMVLDTGADCSILNTVLSEELARRYPRQLRVPNVAALGVTGGVIVGEGVPLPPVRLASVIVRNALALAAPTPIFESWRLTKEPAILVGMDLLSRLSLFSIDYRGQTFRATPMATLVGSLNAFG